MLQATPYSFAWWMSYEVLQVRLSPFFVSLHAFL